MSRYDLTDFEWRVIEPLSPNKPRGVPRVDDRRVLKASSGYCDPVRHGATCRNTMAHVGLGMVGLGEPMLDAMLATDWSKRGRGGGRLARPDSVAGRHYFEQGFQERHGGRPVSLRAQLRER